MDPKELQSGLEAILFVSNEPVKVEELAEAFDDESVETIVAQLEEIRKNFETNVGGFILEQAAGGWRLATRPEHDSILRKYFSKKGENRLSIAALETLAIVAYRQPVTAPEVSDIRGVNATQTIRTLLERRMVRVSGRKNVVGSPFLYRTTREFLVHFGLNDIHDLPRLEEFGDLIGENLNEELVASIQEASQTPESSEIPLAEDEAAVDGTSLELHDESESTEEREEVELESQAPEQQQEE